MLESENDLIWRKAALLQEQEQGETAFLFEPNRTVLAVARRYGHRTVQLCRARPPYRVWERKELGSYTGGPMLARWGGRYLFGGKRWPECKTTLCWLVNDRLYQFAQLPSGGDNWYPAFVALSPACALVSSYSSRQREEKGRRITAIYLAELELSRPPHNPVLPRTRPKGTADFLHRWELFNVHVPFLKDAQQTRSIAQESSGSNS